MPKNSQIKRIEVNSYSGYRANERPLNFLLDKKRYEVKEILDQWCGQDHDYFKVLADDGLVYLLKWDRYLDIWFFVKLMDPKVA